MGKFSRIHHHISKQDLKRVHEQKVCAKKLESERIEKEKEEIKAEYEESKSDWRKEISESDFTNITTGNKVSQTFQHATGATITLDGALGGKMMVPSQVTLDLGFGEKITVDGPTESDFALTGFTKPLDLKVMQRQNVKTAKEINDQLDASIKVSDVDTAKVDIGEDDLGYKSTDEILADVGDQWTYDEYMAMLDAIADKAAAAEEPIAKAIAEYSPTGSTPGDVPISLIDAQEAITNARHKAEQALHQAWERYNKVPDLPSVPDEESDDGDGILDTIANKLGKGPSKDVFDNYMNKLDKGKLTSKPYNINNILQNDATGNQEIAKLQNMIDDVFLDSNYKTDIDRETEINKRYMDARKTFPNLKNILGQFDDSKKDGIKITRNNNGAVTSIKAKKAFDFTGFKDMGGADVVTGLPAMGYAAHKGLPKYFKGKDGKRVESPTMNIEIDFKISNKNHKKKNKYDKFGRLVESNAFSKIKKLLISINAY